jgi:hypothetical protein
LRRISRSNAAKSARSRLSAKKAAVFIAASFSATAVACDSASRIDSLGAPTVDRFSGSGVGVTKHCAGVLKAFGVTRTFGTQVVFAEPLGDPVSASTRSKNTILLLRGGGEARVTDDELQKAINDSGLPSNWA